MSRIIATGAYLPGQAWSNDQLINAYQLESSDEWIVQRTGIVILSSQPCRLRLRPHLLPAKCKP